MDTIKKFQPLLASPAPDDLSALNYPVLVSPKYDGVRAFVRGGVLLSRKLKPIPNQHLQALLGNTAFEGLDGEFVCGDPSAKDCFQRSMSMCMKHDAPIDEAIFFIFDCLNELETPFEDRLKQAKKVLGGKQRMMQALGLSVVNHPLVKTQVELEGWETEVLAMGFEGLMIRDPQGPYKLGRSTTKEGILLKLKRFEHDEAEVLGTFEQLENLNEATTDARGYSKRSSHQEHKRGKGTLGGCVVKMVTGDFKGVEVNVGTGWTDEERRRLWDATIGMTLSAQRRYFKQEHGFMRVKHQKVGAKDKPRFPVFDGWRSVDDT